MSSLFPLADFRVYCEHVRSTTGLSEREINMRLQQRMEQAAAEEQGRLADAMAQVADIEKVLRGLRNLMLGKARGRLAVRALRACWQAYRFTVVRDVHRGRCDITGKMSKAVLRLSFVREGGEEDVQLTAPISVLKRALPFVKAVLFVSRIRDYIRSRGEEALDVEGLCEAMNEAVRFIVLFAESIT
jgi:hypothetical protein